MTQGAVGTESLARRRWLAALHGALLGAWYGGIFLLSVRGTDHGWWMTSLPQEKLDHYFGFERLLLPDFAQRHGIALPNLGVIVSLLVAAGAAQGFLLAALAQWLRIDPERESGRALLEVARSWRLLAVFLGSPLLLGLLALPFWKYDWPVLLPFLFVILAPFLVFNRAWLSWEQRPSFPRPRWPGFKVLGCWIVVFVAWVVIDRGLDLVEEFSNGWIAFVPECLSWFASIVFTIFGTAIWIDRFGILQSAWAQRSRLFSWRTLSAFLAFDVRFGLILLWYFAPLAAIILLRIYVFPQLEVLLEPRGEQLPRALGVAFHWMAEYWWIPIFLATPLLLAAHGRLYVRLFPRSLREH